MSERLSLPTASERITLGSSGVSVSPVCIGQVRDKQVVREAIDRGINFFFVSCDLHWPMYSELREGLREAIRAGLRDRLIIAAASYVTSPAFTVAALDELIAELGPLCGGFDMLVVGGLYKNEMARRLIEALRWRDLGLQQSRSIGATLHDRELALPSGAPNLFDLIFVRYNSRHPGAEADVFPLAGTSLGAPVFVFKSTGGFVDPTQRQRPVPAPLRSMALLGPLDHYRFVMSTPGVSGILCSPFTVEQLKSLVTMLDTASPMTSEERGRLVQLGVYDNLVGDPVG